MSGDNMKKAGLESLDTEQLKLDLIANQEKAKDSDNFVTDFKASPVMGDSLSSTSDSAEDVKLDFNIPNLGATAAFGGLNPEPTNNDVEADPASDDNDIIIESDSDSNASVQSLSPKSPQPQFVPPKKSAHENLSPEEKNKLKFQLLYKIKALSKKGITQPVAVDMTHNLETIEMIYNEMYESYKRKSSVTLQRKMIVMSATFVEFLNNRYDPFDFKLDGWSESIYDSVNNEEYDEVLEELYEKYKTRTKMAPEVKLLMMMGGSAFMHHTLASTFRSNSNPMSAFAGMMGGNASKSSAPNPAQTGQTMSGPSGLDNILNSFKAENA